MLNVALRAVLSLALFALGIAHAGAQVPEAAASADVESADYLKTTALASEEYGLGNYAEARELFRRAHQINPNARTLRGLQEVPERRRVTLQS